MRGSPKMTWVKLHVSGWLHGSIRYQLEPDERGVWADLIAMAGQCLARGRICDNDGIAYPKQYIANQLNISLELLERTLGKCKKEGRIAEIKGVIGITHWKEYQSEYERQIPYRQKASKPDIRKAPYENDADFEERLKLFNASPEPPEDNAEFMRKSGEAVKQAVDYGKENRE